MEGKGSFRIEPGIRSGERCCLIQVLQGAATALANEEELGWAATMVSLEATTKLGSASEVQVRGDLLYLPALGQELCSVPKTDFVQPFLWRAEVMLQEESAQLAW